MDISLSEYKERILRLEKDMPQIMMAILISEGMIIAKDAREVVEQSGHVNTRAYYYGFHTGSKNSNFNGVELHDGSQPRVRKLKHNSKYMIDIYNNVAYAIFLEYGFRQHFVPGRWQGNIFVYDPNAKEGMMMPARKPFQQGTYALTKAEKIALAEFQARLRRKLEHVLTNYLAGGTVEDVNF